MEVPLSRRGAGPGLLVILPKSENVVLSPHPSQPLDPQPVKKWAEESFAVAHAVSPTDIDQFIKDSLDALQALDQVDIKDKFAVIVYDSNLVSAVSNALVNHPRISALVAYGAFPQTSCSVPVLLHLPSNAPIPDLPPSQFITVHSYLTNSNAFIFPQAASYDPGSAALAHSRTLVFLRKHLGGPFFDLEAIWDEHTYFEFVERSVEKTMATMVEEPYVNHVPTMTGGIGRENLTAFYRDHFIFSNPEDATLQVVSRTVGSDRIVDEFVYHITHDRTVDWLLPGVPPTFKKLSIPMMAVVNVRGDRLYNEHIWWDQATALRQAGILPSHLPIQNPQAPEGVPLVSLRLPVAGVETANKLIDETKGRSNEMIGPDWGVNENSSNIK